MELYTNNDFLEAKKAINAFSCRRRNWPFLLQEGEMISTPFFASLGRDAAARGLQAHGMAKAHPTKAFHDLFNMFRDGIDRDASQGKRGYLDSAPLVALPGAGLVGLTATGTAYRDGAFIVVAQAGTKVIDDVDKIAGVLVNQAIAQVVPELVGLLQKLLPSSVMVRAYSDVADIVKHAQQNPLPLAEKKPFVPLVDYEEIGKPDKHPEPSATRPRTVTFLPEPPALIIIN